uniref:DUF4789 domain-containing protein n=1 Tax=Daphnia galeata TaxID=27404 RepID=A0A8J2RVE3_9CRUS|nr:unnamed protein product [Daphnia galeata]
MRVIRLVSILLFSVANFISISEFLQDSNRKGLINARPHWLKMLSKRKSPPTIETFQGITTVEGSMTPIEENLNVPRFLNVGRQNTKCLCTDPSPDAGTVGRSCTTTCTTSETYCGRTCVRSTTYAAMFSLFSGLQKQWDSDVSLSVVITSTYFKVTGKDCKNLESECIASSALVEASQFTGAAVALSAGIAVGAIAIGLAATIPKQEYFNDNNEEENVKHDIIKRSPLFELKSSIEEQLEAVVHLVSSTNVVTTRTFLTIDKNDCDKLEVDCFGSSAIVNAAKSGAVSAIMTGALSAAIAAGAAAFALIPTPVKTREYHNETEEYHQITQRIFRNKIYSRKRRRLFKYRPMGFFESLISKLKSWLIVLLGSSTFNSKSKLNEEDEFKNYDGMPTVIESSIIPSIEDQQHFLNFKRQISSSFCSCADPNPSLTLESAYYGRICSTTCTTTKTLCHGHICMGTTTFTALFTLFLGYQTSADGTFNFISGTATKKFQQIDDKSCAILERDCIVSSALEKARKSGAIAARSAIALSAGIGIGSIALAYLAVTKKSKKEIKKLNQNETEEFYYKKRIERQVKSTYYYDIKENHETIDQPEIESSINLKANSFGFQRQDAGYTCVTDAGNCTTTCLSSKILCGGYCTLTSIIENCNQLSTIQSLYPSSSTSSPSANNESRDTVPSFSFNSTTLDENDCERLEANCIASSAIDSAGRSAEIATGISAVLSAAMVVIAAVVSLNNNNNNNQQSNDNQQTVNINQIPVNNLPIPVIGLDFPRDGCDDSSVRFADGKCHPVLSRGPCSETNRWVTIDPITLQGKCSPRLCTDDKRVFVGRTGLCHDVNDANQCQGGRRLYTTAYGDSICDCPIGQYPFPNSTKDDCVSLFTQGPCPDEQVVTISQGGRLFCGPSECRSANDLQQQLVPTEKGECYALGSQGFCSNNSQVLGYDIFKRQLRCVDKFALKTRSKIEEKRRQDNRGIFRFPESPVVMTIDFLLQPCRTGARQGVNHKCANPLVPDLSIGELTRPPVSPAFTCPRNGSFLQSGGQCVNDNRATSCGPSFQFNEATGQCRPRF